MAAATASSPLDLESIGAHCAFCRQKDFLPFRCESCRKSFCLDHRTETAHYCEKKGAYREARRKALEESAGNTASSQKRSLLNHDVQCADLKCKQLIDTPLVMGVGCDRCNRRYCYKHRLPEEHDCKNLTPLGARPATASAIAYEAQKKNALAALDKIKIWGREKRSAMAAVQVQVPEKMRSTATIDRKREATKLSQLRVEAKKTMAGDTVAAKIAEDQRIYVYLIGADDAVATEKWHKAQAFYNKAWTAGRALDHIAKNLKWSNNNNRVNDEALKLRIFHLKKQNAGGKVLATDQALSVQDVETGDTLILFRGLMPPLADIIQPLVEL